jgi:quercetin dioxygenase-like cupin family protein
MKYTRLYADSDGETHFEDVEVEFGDGQIRSGGPVVGLSAPQKTSDCFFAERGDTSFRDYHPTPRKQWFVRLAGVGEFGASDGEVRQFKAGDVVLLDDMNSKGYITRAVELGNIMFVGLEE